MLSVQEAIQLCKRTTQTSRALSTKHLLSIKEFAKLTEFKLIELLPIDLMWNLRSREEPVYLDDVLVGAFGYSGDLGIQKRNVMELVKRYKIPVARFSNTEYKNFLLLLKEDGKVELLNIYPAAPTTKGLINKIHTLVMPMDLKTIMLSANTGSGALLRKYFAEIETLFHRYLEYQCEFNKRNADAELRELYQLPHNQEYNLLERLRRLDDELEIRYRVGVVYFICEIDRPDIVKIGYTFNLPGRLAELQTAHYKELIVKSYYLTQFPADEECRLHIEHAGSLIRGEWYRM